MASGVCAVLFSCLGALGSLATAIMYVVWFMKNEGMNVDSQNVFALFVAWLTFGSWSHNTLSLICSVYNILGCIIDGSMYRCLRKAHRVFMIVLSFVCFFLLLISSGLMFRKATVSYTGYEEDFFDPSQLVDRCDIYKCLLLRNCSIMGFVTAGCNFIECICRIIEYCRHDTHERIQ